MTREQIIQEYRKKLERQVSDPSTYYSGNVSWCEKFIVELVEEIEKLIEDEVDDKLIGYTNEGYPIYNFD